MIEYAKSDLACLPIEFIEILAENNRKMFSKLDPNEVYTSILELRFSVTILPLIYLLYIVDPEENKLKLVAHKGIDELDIRQKSLVLGEGIIGSTARRGNKQIVYDPAKCAETIAEQLILKKHIGTSVCLPLKIVGKVVGILNFYLEGSSPLSKIEQVMLDILAGHAAVAIQNAHIYNRLKYDREDMDLVIQITRDITSTLALDQVLENILKAAQQIAETNITCLWYKDWVSKKWRRTPPKNHHPSSLKLPDIEHGEGIIGHVLRTGQPYLCNDVRNDPYYFNTWHETKSEIAIPLIIDSEVNGILNIESIKYNAFTERHSRIFSMLAGEAAIALGNAQLFEIADEKTRQFITLKQVSEALSQQKNLEEILSIIAQQSLNIVGQGKKICFVMLIDKEKNMLETKAMDGDITDLNHLDFNIDLNQKPSIVAWVARHGEPRIANDVSKDPQYLDLFPTTKSEICIPLIFRNEVIGVIDIESSEFNAFNDRDIEMLRALADNSAIATKIGELCDIRLKQLQVLYETGRKITATLDLAEVVNLLANEALTAIGSKDRILYVQLVDYEQNSVEIMAVAGDPIFGKDYLNKKKNLDEGISGEVILTGKHYLCPDVSDDDLYLEINAGVKSELVVPIKYNEQVIGLINIESFKKNDFGQYEVHLLQQLANQAGVAIENAKLNENLANAQFELTEVIGNTVVSDALAGLTHDIRTASSLISGEAQWLEYLHEKKQLQLNDVIDSMKKIESQVERIEAMTGDLMQRARSLPPQFVRANLAEITQTSISLTSGYARRQKVEARVNYPSLNFSAQVDTARLKRVFINIIKNAIEAMPDGGILSIRAKRFSKYFDIYFADSGKGIGAEDLKKIWTPFFSSKKGGFGLGLTNCKRIIEREHNGKISIRSVEAKGTHIRIRLPYEQA